MRPKVLHGCTEQLRRRMLQTELVVRDFRGRRDTLEWHRTNFVEEYHVGKIADQTLAKGSGGRHRDLAVRYRPHGVMFEYRKTAEQYIFGDNLKSAFFFAPVS